MKRLLLVLAIAALMAVMLVAMAAPAMAASPFGPNLGGCEYTLHKTGDAFIECAENAPGQSAKHGLGPHPHAG